MECNGEGLYANGHEVFRVGKGAMKLCMAVASKTITPGLLPKRLFDKKAIYSSDPGTSTPKAISASAAANPKPRRASTSIVKSPSGPALNISKDEPTPLVEDLEEMNLNGGEVRDAKKRRKSLVFGK